MTKVIFIKTTRYSAFFKRLFAEYGDGSNIRIDEERYSSADVPKLLESWCTNEKITRTRNFTFSRGGEEIFGFHDHPANLWAKYSELQFLERLHKDKIIRYELCDRQEPMWFRFKKWFLNLTSG